MVTISTRQMVLSLSRPFCFPLKKSKTKTAQTAQKRIEIKGIIEKSDSRRERACIRQLKSASLYQAAVQSGKYLKKNEAIFISFQKRRY